jgi:uncharacterized membrane protein
MNSVPFESVSKFLLFLHLVAAVVVLASGVHGYTRLARSMRHRGAFSKQARLHIGIFFTAYVFTVALGALIYPTFRVRIRHEYLDDALPWATGLFEIKELFAALALLPAFGAFLLANTIDPAEPSHKPHAVMCLTLIAYVLAVLVYNAGCGWYLGTLKSV